jgi:hypothetical protein
MVLDLFSDDTEQKPTKEPGKGFIESALDEVRKALKDVSEAKKEGEKSEGPERPGAAPEVGETSVGGVATKLQARSEFELLNLHRTLKSTVSGGTPKKFESLDLKLTAEKTAEQLAADQLGADATTDQKTLYAKAILSINSATVPGITISDKIPIGTTVKLPGQTADGGITWNSDKGTNTIWNDMSALVRNKDGTGLAHYDYQGDQVQVSWDRKAIENNHWITGRDVTSAAVIHHEQSDTTYDLQGRSIKKTFGIDPAVPSSIAVVDKNGSRMDFTPDTHGEFKGTKTKNGQVIDSAVRMAIDGRIYSISTDADGNNVKHFESGQIGVYNSKGQLTAKKYTDDAGRSVEAKYSGAKPQLDSMTVTDKDGNVIELKRNRSGELHGVKRSTNGDTIDANVAMAKDGRIYSKQRNADATVTKTFESGDRERLWRDGQLIEKTRSVKGLGTVTEHYKDGRKVDHVKVDCDSGCVVELKPAKDGTLSGSKKDSSGNVVDKNMRMKGDELFSEIKDGTNSVHTYENGSVKKFDQNGKLIQEKGKDSAGREYTADFNPGETAPFKKMVKLSSDQPPVEFKRTIDGRMVREEKTSSGAVIQTTELRVDGSLHIANPILNSSTTLDRSGGISSAREVNTFIGNFRQVVDLKGTEISTKQYIVRPDGKSELLKHIAVDAASGTSVEFGYVDGKTDELTIRRPGSTIRLTMTTDGLVGDHRDAGGDVIETAAFKNGKLLFKNVKDGTVRAESYNWDGQHMVPQINKMQYDANTGTVAGGIPGVFELKNSYAPGRLDIGAPFGFTLGMTVTGDISYTRKDGGTQVVHADSSGAAFTDDGKVEMWDANNIHTVDTLTARESAAVKDATIDKRYMLEIHRRFAHDKAKIDGFYEGIDKIQKSKHLSTDEKQALTASLMHHVAYPSEIYQGSSPTCNVTTVQRDLAMTHPEKYAAFVAKVVDDQSFITSAGVTVKFDRENLKMQDYSGRDIGSRVFQTAALHMVRYPKQMFVNTENGVGKWKVINDIDLPFGGQYRELKEGAVFNGMWGAEIVKIDSDITGESKSQISLTSRDDLIALYKKNNGPVTILVDSSTYPFTERGAMTAERGAHVVTITGMEQGPPARFYIQNQWGLGSDHSTTATSIEADDVFNNMMRYGGGKGLVLARAPEANRYFSYSTNPDGSPKFVQTGIPQYDEHLNLIKQF